MVDLDRLQQEIKSGKIPTGWWIAGVVFNLVFCGVIFFGCSIGETFCEPGAVRYVYYRYTLGAFPLSFPQNILQPYIFGLLTWYMLRHCRGGLNRADWIKLALYYLSFALAVYMFKLGFLGG